MKLLLKVKNGTPPQRKSALRQLTDKARDFGAGPLFNQILPLLMAPTLEDQERHLLVKVCLSPALSRDAAQVTLFAAAVQCESGAQCSELVATAACGSRVSGACAQVIDRVLYKLDELVRPFVHKILVARRAGRHGTRASRSCSRSPSCWAAPSCRTSRRSLAIVKHGLTERTRRLALSFACPSASAVESGCRVSILVHLRAGRQLSVA